MARFKATWLLMLANVSCGACLVDIQAMEASEIRAMGHDSFRCPRCGGTNYLPADLLRLVEHVRPKIDPDNPPGRAAAWDTLVGNHQLRRAMEVAIAGHHTLCYVGDPGNGWANVQQIIGARAMIVQKCPCGLLYDRETPCTCTMTEIDKHRKSRVFQAALHADIIVEAVRPMPAEYFAQTEPYTSVLERIKRARWIQAWGGAKMDTDSRNAPFAYLVAARDRLNFDTDQLQRVQRVAVTCAELSNRDKVRAEDMAEAITYRTALLDRL
jgi:predicted ATPase with chaperone activity